MTSKAKTKSPVFESVYQTAADLHRLGLIDQRKMKKFEWMCLKPRAYDKQSIRALRESLQLSQTVLASVLNTSPSTVRQWELGAKKPSGPSLKLLDLLERKGLEAVL